MNLKTHCIIVRLLMIFAAMCGAQPFILGEKIVDNTYATISEENKKLLTTTLQNRLFVIKELTTKALQTLSDDVQNSVMQIERTKKNSGIGEGNKLTMYFSEIMTQLASIQEFIGKRIRGVNEISDQLGAQARVK